MAIVEKSFAVQESPSHRPAEVGQQVKVVFGGRAYEAVVTRVRTSGVRKIYTVMLELGEDDVAEPVYAVYDENELARA